MQQTTSNVCMRNTNATMVLALTTDNAHSWPNRSCLWTVAQCAKYAHAQMSKDNVDQRLPRLHYSSSKFTIRKIIGTHGTAMIDDTITVSMHIDRMGRNS